MKVELSKDQLDTIYNALKNYRWDCYKEEKTLSFVNDVDELRGYILAKLVERRNSES